VSVSAFVLGQVTACGGAHTRERPPQDALSLFAASLTAVKKGLWRAAAAKKHPASVEGTYQPGAPTGPQGMKLKPTISLYHFSLRLSLMRAERRRESCGQIESCQFRAV
jgi:hypothetical protein